MPKAPASTPADPGPPSLPSHLIATVGPKTVGPFFARASATAIVTYIGTTDSGARRLVVVPVTDEGQSRGEPRFVPNLPLDTEALVVRGAGVGFFAGYSAVADRGEVLSVVALGADGAAKGPPVEAARTHDHIAWFDLAPTSRGALCIWAEETRVGDANLFVLPIDTEGKPRAVPARLAMGATGWQTVPTADGVGLALVMPVDAASGKGKAGAVSFRKLDVEGRAIGNPIAIAPSGASTDIDVVPVGGGYVLAWTDRTGEDPEVILAAIDEAGKVQAPKRAMEAIGGSGLVALAAGRSGAVLAWDDPRRRSSSGPRRVHLARISLSPSLDTQEASSVEVFGKGAPELVATPNGFALLAYAQACVNGPNATRDATCPRETPVAPTFVRFDAQLAPQETQPFRIGDKRETAPIGWGLDCRTEHCLAMTATSENPTPIHVVDLAARTTPYHAPLVPPLPAGAPRLTTLKTIGTGEPFSDVAAVQVGDTTLVASLSGGVNDSSDDKRDTSGATLAVRVLDDSGEPKGTAASLTKRALVVGGVAMAAGAKAEDGAAIVWVARDNGDPQVHVARVNKAGKQVNAVQLTGAKGDAADVSIAWAGGGWVVSWVDWRDGNGEVYAAKVDMDLNRSSREERITDAPGDAGDVTLLAQGDKVWIAWTDPRESPKDGFGDIYVTSVSARTAKRATDEVRVMASAAHSRSPSLAMGTDGLLLGWVEDAPLGLDTANMVTYGAMIARLDERGRPLRDPVRAPLAGDGRATAVVLDTEHGAVRGYVARSAHDELVIDAFDPQVQDAPAFPLMTLEAPGSLDVSLAVLSDALYFNDHGATQGERRLRRATVRWRR